MPHFAHICSTTDGSEASQLPTTSCSSMRRMFVTISCGTAMPLWSTVGVSAFIDDSLSRVRGQRAVRCQDRTGRRRPDISGPPGCVFQDDRSRITLAGLACLRDTMGSFVSLGD